jgi:hypothetical protein
MIHTLLRGALALALLGALLGGPARAAAAQSALPGWRDTGVTLGQGGGGFCFDGAQPNVVITSDSAEGTVAYNWATGQRTVLNPRPLGLCGVDGSLYAPVGGGGWRFSSADPDGQFVPFMVTHAAEDGSSWTYALPGGQLWASSDGGRTVHERGRQFAGRIDSLAVAPADGRALYLLTADRDKAANGKTPFAIHFSPDGGATWERRYSGDAPGAGMGFPSFTMTALEGASPVTALRLQIAYGSGSGSPPLRLYSTDGARTFQQLTTGLDYGADVLASSEGVITKTYTGNTYGLTLQRPDGSKESLLTPPGPEPGYGSPPEILVSRNAPANLFVNRSGDDGLWHSPDGGRTWNLLGAGKPYGVKISPYLPLTLATVENGRLYVIDLPDAGRRLTAPAAPSNAAGGSYHAATGHTLSPLFGPYWSRSGGLAQFGYPRTEPFREVNPADGRIYTVQYLERNRFEYHPEHRGTPYEVLLGLLGNQQTEARRQAGEAPFRPVDPPGPSGARFFPETGHSLGGVFRTYWERRGGLAIYGFPISEPFEEVNPEDGQTYLVQYFERNRFEYHPEHRGTPYEVLLGLLGNTLLREKGWL